MEFICNFIWEKNGRAKNEDALTFKHMEKGGKEYLLAVVCDGIGGLPEGENASSFVADSMGKEMIRLLEKSRNMNKHKWRNAFLRRIYQCHKWLGTYGKEREIRLGTTLSMVFLCGDRGYFFHVGDSAVFFGRRRLKRRTETHRTKNGALQQAVGVGQTPRVEWKGFRVRKGSVILLASDGFYQRVEKELMDASAVKDLKKSLMHGSNSKKEEGDETKIREWLLDKYRVALRRGERDNVSAVCVVCR